MATPNLEDILQLSISERLKLVEEIWDTIAEFPDEVPLTQAQLDEIDRRIDAYEQRPNAGLPWREVLEKMRASDG